MPASTPRPDSPTGSPTPADRSRWGRHGALAIHSRGKTNTGPATRAARDRFLALVDPDNRLTPEERERRAGFARRLHMSRISMLGVQARRRRTDANRGDK